MTGSMLYAAYGSNLHPARLNDRIAGARLAGAGLLAGYELAFHKRGQDDSGKCTVVPGTGAVHVAVYEMGAPDVAVLHEIEGTGRGYEVMPADVPGFGRCFTYIAMDAYIDDTLTPFDWYRRLVIDGCRYHGFPASYVTRIGAVPTQPDPDESRVARYARLAARMAVSSRGSGTV